MKVRFLFLLYFVALGMKGQELTSELFPIDFISTQKEILVAESERLKTRISRFEETLDQNLTLSAIIKPQIDQSITRREELLVEIETLRSVEAQILSSEQVEHGFDLQIKLLEQNATLFEDLFWAGNITTLYSSSEKKNTFNGWVKAYYKNPLNKKLRKLCYYLNGRPFETITFKPSGEICTETTLRNGNGKETHWHTNGVKREISSYRNGLTNGEFKLWYNNGNLEQEGTYLNGFLHGMIIHYKKDGSVSSKALFEQGKFLYEKPVWSSFHFRSSEERTFWDKLDEWDIKDESKRRNDKGEIIDNHSSNAFTGYVKERSSHGTNSRILSQFEDGFVVRCKSWYQSGKVHFDFKYKSGQREGLSIAWHENGQKKAEQNFKDGQLDGVAFEWYKDGKKKSEINFKAGKRDGVAFAWYENGQIELENYFKEGKKHGTFKRWNENGQKKVEVEFKDDLIQK